MSENLDKDAIRQAEIKAIKAKAKADAAEAKLKLLELGALKIPKKSGCSINISSKPQVSPPYSQISNQSGYDSQRIIENIVSEFASIKRMQLMLSEIKKLYNVQDDSEYQNNAKGVVDLRTVKPQEESVLPSRQPDLPLVSNPPQNNARYSAFEDKLDAVINEIGKLKDRLDSAPPPSYSAPISENEKVLAELKDIKSQMNEKAVTPLQWQPTPIPVWSQYASVPPQQSPHVVVVSPQVAPVPQPIPAAAPQTPSPNTAADPMDDIFSSLSKQLKEIENKLGD